MGNCSLEYCPQTGAVLNLGPEFYQIIFSSMKIVFRAMISTWKHLRGWKGRGPLSTTVEWTFLLGSPRDLMWNFCSTQSFLLLNFHYLCRRHVGEFCVFDYFCYHWSYLTYLTPFFRTLLFRSHSKLFLQSCSCNPIISFTRSSCATIHRIKRLNLHSCFSLAMTDIFTCT